MWQECNRSGTRSGATLAQAGAWQQTKTAAELLTLLWTGSPPARGFLSLITCLLDIAHAARQSWGAFFHPAEGVFDIMASGDFLSNYFPILVFLGIAAGVSIAAVIASLIAGLRRPDDQKLSPYECGFDAFDETHHKFDVRFYLVAILFIIFDLEVAFLFPWAVSLSKIGLIGFWSMMVFLGVLTVGFIYEWKKGALEWE